MFQLLKTKYLDCFHTKVLSESFAETDRFLQMLKFHLNCFFDRKLLSQKKKIHHVQYFSTACICCSVFQRQHWKWRSNHTVTSSQGCPSLTIEFAFLLIIFSLSQLINLSFQLTLCPTAAGWTKGLLCSPLFLVLRSSMRVLHPVKSKPSNLCRHLIGFCLSANHKHLFTSIFRSTESPELLMQSIANVVRFFFFFFIFLFWIPTVALSHHHWQKRVGFYEYVCISKLITNTWDVDT